MYPESPSLLLKPVSAQLSLDSAVLLHPDAVVELRVQRGHPALFTIDGAVDIDLSARGYRSGEAKSLLGSLSTRRPAPSFPPCVASATGLSHSWGETLKSGWAVRDLCRV